MSVPGRDTNDSRHGDISGRTSDLKRSIRPGVPVPATVLVAAMHDGGLLVQGWRDGPSAYVYAGDAGPLWRALEMAFGADAATTSNNRNQP